MVVTVSTLEGVETTNPFLLGDFNADSSRNSLGTGQAMEC